jgi:hypothetical protein
VTFRSRGRGLELLLLKELHSLLAGDVGESDPAANVGAGEVAEGATADLGEDCVGAMLGYEQVDEAAATGGVVLEEDEAVAFGICCHDPFGFSEVPRDLSIWTVVYHHYRYFAHEILTFRSSGAARE